MTTEERLIERLILLAKELQCAEDDIRAEIVKSSKDEEVKLRVMTTTCNQLREQLAAAQEEIKLARLGRSQAMTARNDLWHAVERFLRQVRLNPKRASRERDLLSKRLIELNRRIEEGA